MTTVLFDVTRLFLRGPGTTPTGIDRVVEAYGRWLLSRPDIQTIPVCTLGGVVTPLADVSLGRMVARRAPSRLPETDDWDRLVAALAADGPESGLRPAGPGALAQGADRKWRRYAAAGFALVASRRRRPIPPGAIYINVSHFGLEQPGLLARLDQLGAKSVVMIHDLIPLIHPEYCSPSAEGWHRKRIDAVLAHASLVIANSQATADDLRSYASDHGRPAPTTCVAPLGLESAFVDFISATPAGTAADRLRARPYFLCVGTIEPRKNLTLLLTLWRRLADVLGEETPALVLAGRRGWETEAIVDHLDRSPPIRRFVHEATGLGDAHLARLIGDARALLSPSFIEGFNLPVAEALAIGTPVIASDIAVHRELAPEALLIDPLDGPGWLEAIHSANRKRSPTRVRPPPTWTDHFAVVASALGLQG